MLLHLYRMITRAMPDSQLYHCFTKASVRIVKLIAPRTLRGLAFVSVSTLQLSSLSIIAIQIIRYEVRVCFIFRISP